MVQFFFSKFINEDPRNTPLEVFELYEHLEIYMHYVVIK